MTYIVSTDKTKLDVPLVHNFLTTSYWAKGRTLATVTAAIKGSLCFGVYHHDPRGDAQVGFARVVTDYATFAYLADVFVLEAHRGHALGKQLIKTVLTYPELQTCSWTLFTQDAHDFYAQFGFTRPAEPERLMRRKAVETLPLG